jgi:archaellum component FlaF (FlaF/FlaG flagellin family)
VNHIKGISSIFRYIILDSIHESINQELEKKYKTLDEKLNRLVRTQTYKPDNTANFYPRVVNKANVTFSDDELTLLNNGLKYNLNHKHKHWLNNLAFEAETAITLLPTGEQDYIRYQVAHNIKRLYKQQNDQQARNNMQTKSEEKTINEMKEN